MSRRATIGAAVAALMIAGGAHAQGLFGWGTFTPDESLYSIDVAPPMANFIGGPNSGVIIAEIEWGGGVIYGSDTSDNTRLHQIDPVTGLIFDTITMSFPSEGNVITSMEFVGDTLYAGLTTEGGGTTYLSTIDLGTGVVSTIGSTGFGSPFGGLAWDGDTMYGISAGGSGAELFTVNLGSGAATSVGLVTIDGVGLGTTALEFGTDGVLYALPNINEGIAGHLLSIDPSTANATDLGFTGQNDLVALTSIPAPGMIALLGIAGLVGRTRRRD
jgi:hypothetical protein